MVVNRVHVSWLGERCSIMASEFHVKELLTMKALGASVDNPRRHLSRCLYFYLELRHWVIAMSLMAEMT